MQGRVFIYVVVEVVRYDPRASIYDENLTLSNSQGRPAVKSEGQAAVHDRLAALVPHTSSGMQPVDSY